MTIKKHLLARGIGSNWNPRSWEEAEKRATEIKERLELKEKRNREQLYLVGACAWLFRDLMSDPDTLGLLRSLKDAIPLADYVGLASLNACYMEEHLKKYERDLTSHDEVKRLFPQMTAEQLQQFRNEVIDQFAMSSDYLDSWLRLLFKVPHHEKPRVNKAIEQAVSVALGERKSDMDLLLQWVAGFPQGYTMSLETVRNKAIEIKNREA